MLTRSTGLAFSALTVREFARGSQPAIYALKSSCEAKCLPGRNDVSK